VSSHETDPRGSDGDEDGLAADLASLADRLRANRPVPSAAWRRKVLDRLAAVAERDERHTVTLIALFASCGAALLTVGALVTFL